MKKPWKERLHDFCFWLLMVPSVLSLCSLGIWIVFLFCGISFSISLNETWMNVLFSSFWMNAALAILLSPVCAPITSYDKETFLRNKVRYVLFSDSWTNYISFIILAAIVMAIFSEELKKMSEAEMMEAIIIPGVIAIMAISCMLSKYCQKKIVHIEKNEK